jgi:predicted alpha/beta-fold hydrolase
VIQVRHQLALSIERILSLSTQLANPRYVPTLWAADTWTNLILFILKQTVDKKWIKSINKANRELLIMEDGGTVSIDFAEDDHLPSTAPIVIFLHTITGSSYEFCA